MTSLHRVVTDIVQLSGRDLQVGFITLDNLVIEAVGASEGTAARRHESDPPALGIYHFLEIKYPVIFKGQRLKSREGAHRVFYDSSTFSLPGIWRGGRVLLCCEGPDIIPQGVLAFTDKHGFKKARGHDFRRGHGNVDTAAHQGQGKMPFDLCCDIQRVLKLVGDCGKGYEVRIECPNIIHDAGHIKRIAQLFVNIEKRCVMADLFEHGGEKSHAIVESYLRKEVRVNKKDFHIQIDLAALLVPAPVSE